ncbi:MAG: DNA ligase [Pseudomonadota bacterium]|nr:DNA ligase [Pseudomonadota bacterium]
MKLIIKIGLVLWFAQALVIRAANPPALMLAERYETGVDLDAYWVSEKLDGVRGYWNGTELLTRGGHRIETPPWFTQAWPSQPLDGELWMGRARFAELSGTVRRTTPDEAAWHELKFMVFDLPAHPGSFDERLAALRELIPTLQIPWLRLIEQSHVANAAELDRRLDRVVAAGGEGLMLHRGAAPYRAIRSDDLLKLKPYDDAEARVVGYVPGQGKYQGVLGSLVVERPDGLQFRLGSGFSDEQRADPPALGSWVTYRYNGFTVNGIPRFARFMRIRDEMPPPDPPAEPAQP